MSEEEEIIIRGPSLRPTQRDPRSARVKRFAQSKSRSSQPNPSANSGPNDPPHPSQAATVAHEHSCTTQPILHHPNPSSVFPIIHTKDNDWNPLVSTNPQIGMRGYLQDLHVVEVKQQEGAQPAIPLCPFILAHLRPIEHIIPFMPLYLPSCPGYIFHLLYVNRENLGDHISCIAVFILFNLEDCTSHPSYVGTRVSEAFLDTVNLNIQRERTRLRALSTEARFTYSA